MAYRVEKITSPKSHPDYLATKDFVCDSTDDISNLPRFEVLGTQMLGDGTDPYNNEPVNFGSTATVCTPFSGYKLAPKNEWVKIF